MKKVYESPEMDVISFSQIEDISSNFWTTYALSTSSWGDNETIPDDL